MKNRLLAIAIMGLSYASYAVDNEIDSTLTLSIDSSQLEVYMTFKRQMDSIESTFTYEYGEVFLKDDLATIHVPEGFKYLRGFSKTLLAKRFYQKKN